VGHATEGIGHGLADRGLPVGDDPGNRHRDRVLDLEKEFGQVGLSRGEQAFGQEDLTGEDVADDPENLVADIGLEAVDGQDHSPGGGRDSVQPSCIGARQGEQFVIAIEEVGDGPLADGDAAAGELGVDLRDAAVLGVSESADQGDDVETELVMRQSKSAFLLGAEADAPALALGVATAAELEVQSHDAFECDDGSSWLGGRPEGS
jgi:hypothetical protein